MKLFFIWLIAILLAVVGFTDVMAGTGAIPKGPDVLILKPNLLFKGGDIKIMTGDDDIPTITAKDAEKGTAYIRKSTGVWYNKTDDGSTTAWQLFIQGAIGLIGTDNCSPRWDGTGSGVLQDGPLCISDLGVGTGLSGLFVDGDGHFDTFHVGGTSQSTTAGLTFEVEDTADNSILQVTDSGNVVFTSPTASKPLQLDASNVLYSGDINATLDIDGVLPVEHGGIGLDASAAANGQILIGNGTGFDLNVVSGTLNQVIMTPSAGGITLSLPQDIHAGSAPTFVSGTFTGLLPNHFVGSDGALGLQSLELLGTADQVVVTSGSSSYTLSTPQDIATTSSPSFSGLAVGLPTADPSAIVQIDSTTQGFTLPRMTTAQKIAVSPSLTGNLVFDTDESRFNFWDGALWVGLETVGGSISIYDGFVGSAFTSDVNAAVAAFSSGDSIGYKSEIRPVAATSQTITKTLGFTGGGNGSVINGPVIFSTGSDGSSLNNLKIDGSITIDAGVKNLMLMSIWLTAGNSIIDNSGNNTNMIIVVIEE